MKAKAPFAIVVGILILVVGLWCGKQLLREHSRWSKTINLADGRALLVHQTASQRRYFGHPHLFGFGGGDPWGSLTFAWKESDRTWEGPYIPICLQLDEQGPHLIVFDRETDFDHITFRYFALEGEGWLERPFHSFPKNLALQNLWLKENAGYRNGVQISDYRTVSLLDPKDVDFQDSLTARLWCCLVKNEQYWQNSTDWIDAALLADYKARHITRASTP